MAEMSPERQQKDAPKLLEFASARFSQNLLFGRAASKYDYVKVRFEGNGSSSRLQGMPRLHLCRSKFGSVSDRSITISSAVS